MLIRCTIQETKTKISISKLTDTYTHEPRLVICTIHIQSGIIYIYLSIQYIVCIIQFRIKLVGLCIEVGLFLGLTMLIFAMKTGNENENKCEKA